jgi:glutamate N-acetyltransferase/amino-acid N-acetyltransferase
MPRNAQQPDQPGITTPSGFYAAGTACGIKPSGLPDLTLIAADRLCAAAGTFTRSRTVGAPVAVNKRHLRTGEAAAIVCNSGNANASTGKQGQSHAIATCRLVTEQLQAHGPAPIRRLALKPRQVLVASTGIIGQPLPMERLEHGIQGVAPRLARGDAADGEAARAVLTTDLVSKTASRQLKIGNKTVRLGGIAKGSGMIAPNMATLLCFITTDAAIAQPALQQALKEAVAASFNRTSVDQHTSPSDMALALASGAAGNTQITARSKHIDAFRQALYEVCQDLAYQVVKDGEGATRVFRVRITGARDEREADRVGKAIVDSPLVKTAVHGGDPNWGRVITAAGYSGAALQPERMSLYIGGEEATCVYEQAGPRDLTQAEQDRLHSAMRQKEIAFHLDLGRGQAWVDWLGCDLSRQYITINADYTT